MTILHVIPDLCRSSGPTTFCVRICEELANEQTAMVILCNRATNEGRFMPANRFVRVADGWHDVKRLGKPDVMHVHALWDPLSHAAAVFARKHKIPYLVSAHGMLAPWALQHKWLKKRVAWWLYQKRDLEDAEMFHVTAECEVNWLRDLGFKQPCVMAPLGADLPDQDPAKSLRRRDFKTVLFLGRVYPVKGLMNLVKAWACLLETTNDNPLNARGGTKAHVKTVCGSQLTINGCPWRLIIAGPDQAGHKAELVAEAIRLGLTVADVSPSQLICQSANLPPSQSSTPPLAHDIIFTGPVFNEEKEALYRMADLFVLPSFSENFGAVVVDALAYGVPVITTKGTPWKDLENCGNALMGECFKGKDENKARWSEAETILTQSKNEAIIAKSGNQAYRPVRAGWWIDVGEEPLEHALRESMNMSDSELGLMGRNGRQLVEQQYTWPVIATRMRQGYERMRRSVPGL